MQLALSGLLVFILLVSGGLGIVELHRSKTCV